MRGITVIFKGGPIGGEIRRLSQHPSLPYKVAVVDPTAYMKFAKEGDPFRPGHRTDTYLYEGRREYHKGYLEVILVMDWQDPTWALQARVDKMTKAIKDLTE